MSKQRMWKKYVSLGIMAVSATLAMSAQADDRKAYSGLSCVETTPPVETVYTYFATAKNTHPSLPNNVQCSATRDNTLSSQTVSDWDVTVNRFGNTSAWDVRFWTVSRDGQNGGVSSLTVPASPSTGWQNLDGPSVTGSFTDGTVLLETDLPPNSEIASFVYQESGVTD